MFLMLVLELSVTLVIFISSGKQSFSSSLLYSGSGNLFQARNDFALLNFK